ncbi:hypothetical protein BJV82DRAFT_279281 [Fennellomyces sp. T-0311]|nr:hypothetical protein BJV82DRAFT_279281 [Fennellomyces sp. T-0311]
MNSSDAHLDDQSRRSSLSISALLNDVAVDPYRSPEMDHPHRSKLEHSEPLDYFSPLRSPGGPSPIMSSSVASSPGPPRKLERPKSWHKDTITPEGYHRRTNSNGDVIVSTIAKAKRKRISPEQFRRLMEVFEQTDTPSSEVRENLASELGMTKREVQVFVLFFLLKRWIGNSLYTLSLPLCSKVWFQNRRAKTNRTRAAQAKQHLTPQWIHGQPLVRRASANSVLESTRRRRPPQPQPTLSFPPTGHPSQQQQLQPIAPMPARPLPYIHIDESTSGQKRHLTPTEPDYFSFGSERGIHHSLANLTLTPRKRVRSRSSIDMLASAAQYINNEGSSNHG